MRMTQKQKLIYAVLAIIIFFSAAMAVAETVKPEKECPAALEEMTTQAIDTEIELHNRKMLLDYMIGSCLESKEFTLYQKSTGLHYAFACKKVSLGI